MNTPGLPGGRGGGARGLLGARACGLRDPEGFGGLQNSMLVLRVLLQAAQSRATLCTQRGPVPSTQRGTRPLSG